MSRPILDDAFGHHVWATLTARTTLGIEPPDIDVWTYADAVGRLVETPPTG